VLSLRSFISSGALVIIPMTTSAYGQSDQFNGSHPAVVHFRLYSPRRHLIGNYGSTLLPDGLHFFHHLLTYFTVLMLIIACTSFPLKTVSSSFSNITCELAKLFGCHVPKCGNRLAADKCPHSKEKQDDTTDGGHG
jgi:hypothetical protein